MYMYIHLSIYLSIYLYFSLSLYIYLSIYLSISLSLYIYELEAESRARPVGVAQRLAVLRIRAAAFQR